jgi:uncharacterized BrkB/YihY/UPF0761 family membrane protein
VGTITSLFTWYISSGLIRYETIYGPLGTLIILMLWLYLASSDRPVQAHLTACLTKSRSQAGFFEKSLSPEMRLS